MESPERPWLVVHFIEEDSVEAVPAIWYISESNICNWPPKQLGKHLSDFIKNRQVPGEDWPTYPAKILGHYDDFQTAKKKAVKAQDTTDLSSNCENVKTMKRKRIQNIKYVSTDSESNFDSDENSYPHLPKKRTLSQPINNTQRQSPYQRQSSKERFCSSPCSSEVMSKNQLQPLFNRIRSTTNSPQSSRSESEDILQNMRQTDRIQRQINNSRKFLLSQSTSGSNMEMKEFQRQVLNQLNILSAKISDNTDTLQMLLGRSASACEENKENDLLDNILPLFPLKDDQQLNEMEEFLRLNSNVTPMAKELSRMGGDSAKELVKKIMYRTVSNELGQLFSWDGAKGKRPFKNLLLCQVILKAVRMNIRTQHCDEDESIKTVKLWLVRAKDRIKNSLQKKQKQNNQQSTEQITH